MDYIHIQSGTHPYYQYFNWQDPIYDIEDDLLMFRVPTGMYPDDAPIAIESRLYGFNGTSGAVTGSLTLTLLDGQWVSAPAGVGNGRVTVSLVQGSYSNDG